MNDCEHKPDPRRVQSRCRVDCSCGWRGPLVPTFGAGSEAWKRHFFEDVDHGDTLTKEQFADRYGLEAS